MAVSENDLVVGPLTPAAGVTTISLDFFFEEASWIEVYKAGSETPLVLGVDYTVANENSRFGVVTLNAAANGTDKYSVYLAVPLQRSSDMQLRGEFKSAPFNVEMDRIWQRLQYHWTLIQKTMRVGRTSRPISAFNEKNVIPGINSLGDLDTSVSLSGLIDTIALANSLASGNTLSFPLDLGLVSDPVVTTSYDLGSI